MSTNFTSLRTVAPTRSFVNQVVAVERQAHQSFEQRIAAVSPMHNDLQRVDSFQSLGSSGRFAVVLPTGSVRTPPSLFRSARPVRVPGARRVRGGLHAAGCGRGVGG